MPATYRYRPERDSWQVIVRKPGKKPTARTIGRGPEAEIEARDTAAAINEDEQRAGRFLSRGAADPMPTSDVLREWFATYRKSFAPGYEKLVAGMIDNHLAPFFGARDLRSLRRHDAIAFASHMIEQKAKSLATAKNGLVVMSMVLALHVPDHIDRNHFSGLGKMLRGFRKRAGASGRKRQRGAWTKAELAKILELARRYDPWLYEKIVFASHTGARQNEMLGLRWPAVSFELEQVCVREQLGQDGEGVDLKQGEASVIVPMGAAGPLLREVLEAIAGRQGVDSPWATPELVFQASGGGPIDASNFRKRWSRFQRRLLAEKIRVLDWHSFRATFISNCLLHRVPVKRVAEWVGHSTTYITERYNHAIPDESPVRGWLDSGELRPVREAKA